MVNGTVAVKGPRPAIVPLTGAAGPGRVVKGAGVDAGEFVPAPSVIDILTVYAAPPANPVKVATRGVPDSVTVIPFWGEFAAVTVVVVEGVVDVFTRVYVYERGGVPPVAGGKAREKPWDVMLALGRAEPVALTEYERPFTNPVKVATGGGPPDSITLIPPTGEVRPVSTVVIGGVVDESVRI